MARVRRTLACVFASLTLIGAPVVAAGCGAGTHTLVNAVAHKVALHFAHNPKEKRAVNVAFCVSSVYLAFKDFKGNHKVYGALNAIQALKNCKAGFAKNGP